MILLSFLQPREQLGLGQLTCRKWYEKFVPLLDSMPRFRPNYPDQFLKGKRFRIAYHSCDQRGSTHVGSPPVQYLALLTDLRSDCRGGDSYFVSLGTSERHKDCLWVYEDDKRIKLDSPINTGQVMKWLASHRSVWKDWIGDRHTGSTWVHVN